MAWRALPYLTRYADLLATTKPAGLMQKLLAYITFVLLILVAFSIFLIVIVSGRFPDALFGSAVTVRDIGIALFLVGSLGAIIIVVQLAHALIQLRRDSDRR